MCPNSVVLPVSSSLALLPGQISCCVWQHNTRRDGDFALSEEDVDFVGDEAGVDGLADFVRDGEEETLLLSLHGVWRGETQQ
jgi:hypothetical protein